ncbi:MAG: hypothetical protein KJO08_04055, partial [Gammaproteobacteria bacterium]|nr:hypothetical protein [Gammaproteobacteria bacterium]
LDSSIKFKRNDPRRIVGAGNRKPPHGEEGNISRYFCFLFRLYSDGREARVVFPMHECKFH